MSLKTIEEGIAVAKRWAYIDECKPTLVLSTSRPVFRKKEAGIKKKMVLEAGLNLCNVVIIPEMMDTYSEAKWLGENIPDGSNLIVVAEKWHAPRVARSLKMTLPSGVKMRLEKVDAKIERHLDASRLRSWLCGATRFNYILWQWLFYLITPYMMRRQMKKK